MAERIPESEIVVISKSLRLLTASRDVLKRHYKRCVSASTSALPEPALAGRHRTACDACAKCKITCDRLLNCAACTRRGTECTYKRLETPSLRKELAPRGELETSTGRQLEQLERTTRSQKPDRTGQLSVPFLLNYSAPTNRNPGDVNQALTLLSTKESNSETVDLNLPSLGIGPEGHDLAFESSWALFFGTTPEYKPDGNSVLPEGLDNLDQRQHAADRMIDCLFTANAASYDYTDCVLDIEGTRAFISEQNIGNYIEAYFESTVRPRSRIVLKSTFCLESTSAPLLLTIFLMGATCGKDEDAKLHATAYADLVELVIFENPVFLQLVYSQDDTKGENLLDDEIQIIQAAILIMLIQLASPRPDARRRVRIQRYPALVSIARATCLTKIRNKWHDSSVPLDHAAFLKNELCIRLVAAVYHKS